MAAAVNDCLNVDDGIFNHTCVYVCVTDLSGFLCVVFNLYLRARTANHFPQLNSGAIVRLRFKVKMSACSFFELLEELKEGAALLCE